MRDVCRKKLSGQITVLASLVIVLVISVVTALIKSASDTVVKAQVGVADSLAMEGVFSQYSRPLLDEFDLMFFYNNKNFNQELEKMIQNNIGERIGIIDVSLENAACEEMITPLDNGGEAFRQEIIDYMKTGIFADVTDRMLTTESDIKKSEKTKEIVEKITDCEEATSQLDGKILAFVEAVEGIDATDTGLRIKNEKPVSASDSFAKQCVYGDITMENVSVSNGKVFDAMQQNYIDIEEILDDMLLNIDGLREEYEETVADESVIDSYTQIYARNRNELRQALSDSNVKCATAVAIADEYNQTFQEVTQKIDGVSIDVEGSRDALGNELTQGLSEDLQELKNYSCDDNAICNMQEMSEKVSVVRTVLENAIAIVDSVENLSIDNYIELQATTENLQSVCSQLNEMELLFNYSGVNFESNSEGLSYVERLYRQMKNGVMGMVIDDDSNISNKSIAYYNLASSNQSSQAEQNSILQNMAQDAVQNMLYNEYVANRFQNYLTDDTDSEKQLDYMMEYIISGNKSDKENLENVVNELVAMKAGANMAYLFTDYQKKEKCYALALSSLGFTGVHAVVKAGQYLLMTVWAYGEAISDCKLLYQGKKVDFVKTRTNWRLSLENLLAAEFDTQAEGDENGNTYKEYLKFLLYVENPQNKYFRTMDAMEIRMIELGHENFRLKNYIYSIKASATFSINKNAYYYAQDFDYSY